MRRNQPYTSSSPFHSSAEDSAGTAAKISFLSGIVACVCIVVYLGSMLLAGIRIYTGITERRALAAKEFSGLLNLSPAEELPKDPELFSQTITNALTGSTTLQGVIITGLNQTYAFERNQGSIVAWNGPVPRFKPLFGVSKKPLVKQVEIRDDSQQLQRLTVSAVYNYIADDLLIAILKRTLLIVLITLCLALFTLLFQFLLANPLLFGAEKEKSDSSNFSAEKQKAEKEEEIYTEISKRAVREAEEMPPITPPPSFQPEPPAPEEAAQAMVRTHISQELQTAERLASELRRCSAFSQDLVFMLIELQEPEPSGEKGGRLLEEEAVKFFLRRDLIFEQGQKGIAVILPSTDLDQGFAKSEQFYNRMLSKYAETLDAKAEVYMGLSSRADRTIDADRLIFEAAGALQKAWEDPASPIVAFRSDPEKYKAFIDAQNKT
ncbi:MAG: hypothetical protein LBG87_09240 [Spirochaetaceae bacterium]|jgi:hypothetical protein|nr:hypothetical protein [Spirochaetaceae bacterium]